MHIGMDRGGGCAAILACPHPRDRTDWEERSASANVQEVIPAELHAFFEEYLAETERLLANFDPRGFF